MNVLVLGNSVCRMVVPAGGPGDVAFPTLVGRVDGVHVENQSRWFEVLDEGSRRFRFELRARMPDVLVVGYGAAECQPGVLPLSVSRHLMTWDKGLGPVASRYRSHVVPRVWPPLRRWQRWATEKSGSRSWHVPPHRFAASLHQLVETARYDGAQVLVLDVLPFGPRIEHFLPGMEARRRTYQAAIEGVVESFDTPDVRLVPVSRVAEEMGVETAVPDGLHLSPVAHRHVAEMLAAELVRSPGAPW